MQKTKNKLKKAFFCGMCLAVCVVVSVTSTYGQEKTIRPVNDKNKCMTVQGGVSAGDGAKILLKSYGGHASQQWVIDGFNITLKADPARCLDLTDGKTNNGNQIRLWSCNGSNAQQWKYDKRALVIRYQQNWNKCLELHKGKTDENTRIEIQDCNSSKAQMWVMKRE